ncbi:MAG: shikimate kinase [Trueperaceae bacterium]
MRLYLTGVACVGKTTIGRKAAALLGLAFFDLDQEVEAFFKTAIPRLRREHLTEYSYRKEAAKALAHLLSCPESFDSIIALPPSGLMQGYLAVLKKHPGVIAALWDKPENILERITFYDDYSRQIERSLSERERRLYLKEIKADMSYFGRTYRQRAHLQIEISGLDAEGAANAVKEKVEAAFSASSINPNLSRH